MIIKAYSIRQPWANLVVFGPKGIETRDKNISHRGPLAIHVAKTIDWEALNYFRDFFPSFNTSFQGKVYNKYAYEMSLMENSQITPTLGMILGTSNLSEVIEFDKDNYCSLRHKHFIPPHYPMPKYGYDLTDRKPLETPIPWRGMPGLFDVEIPDSVISVPSVVNQIEIEKYEDPGPDEHSNRLQDIMDQSLREDPPSRKRPRLLRQFPGPLPEKR